MGLEDHTFLQAAEKVAGGWAQEGCPLTYMTNQPQSWWGVLEVLLKWLVLLGSFFSVVVLTYRARWARILGWRDWLEATWLEGKGDVNGGYLLAVLVVLVAYLVYWLFGGLVLWLFAGSKSSSHCNIDGFRTTTPKVDRWISF